MFRKGRNKNIGGREAFVNLRKSRDDIPQPRGKFRNLFEEKGMMPESLKAKPDAPKYE